MTNIESDGRADILELFAFRKIMREFKAKLSQSDVDESVFKPVEKSEKSNDESKKPTPPPGAAS